MLQKNILFAPKSYCFFFCRKKLNFVAKKKLFLWQKLVVFFVTKTYFFYRKRFFYECRAKMCRSQTKFFRETAVSCSENAFTSSLINRFFPCTYYALNVSKMEIYNAIQWSNKEFNCNIIRSLKLCIKCNLFESVLG